MLLSSFKENPEDFKYGESPECGEQRNSSDGSVPTAAPTQKWPLQKETVLFSRDADVGIIGLRDEKQFRCQALCYTHYANFGLIYNSQKF